MTRRIFLSSIILSSIILLTACAQPVTYAPQMSPEELAAEEALQLQMVEEAKAMGGAPRPWRKRGGITKQFERVADKIDKEGARVCQEMGLPAQNRRCYYYFRLASSRELNAHADGKNIVINSGMMYFLADDDEVGIVLGHELAHNMMAHPDGARQNVMAGAIVGALLDGVAASQGVGTGGDFTNLGAQAGRASYSVEFEQEADYVGLYIAARAGYDIRKAPGLWRRMSVEEPDMTIGDTSHPSNSKRAAMLARTIQEIDYKRRHRVPLLPDFKPDI